MASQPPPPPDVVEAAQSLGERRLRSLRELLKENPFDAGVWVALCRAYSDIDAQLEAIDSCREALKIDPDRADALLGLGAAYAALGRTADAQTTLTKYVALDPRAAGKLPAGCNLQGPSVLCAPRVE